MNQYQFFIRKVEEEYREAIRNRHEPYLCVCAETILNRYPKYLQKQHRRFTEEIDMYINYDLSVSGYIYNLMNRSVYLFNNELIEYRFLILHRMYQDAEYDYWSE